MNISRTLTATEYLVTHRVGHSQTGIRLDRFLKARYRKRSREQLKRAIDAGAVSLKRNQGPHLSLGRPKPSSQLIAGDEVLVLSERKPEPPVCFDYQILFEDPDLFVINKPANLPVHPAGRYFFNTLLVHLKTQGHRSPLDADMEYYLVHRIDKETSGVLVLTKTKDSCSHITHQFAERSTKKKYLAIVKGICPETFIVDLGIKRASNSVIELKMMTCAAEDGLASLTEFKRISTHGNFSLIECVPKTGRQHQIRVHLESAGHPIVGDKLYGISEKESIRFYERQNLSPEAEAAAAAHLLIPRHALHAHQIEFTHPRTGKKVQISAPLPTDLQDFLDRADHSKELGNTPSSFGLFWNNEIGHEIDTPLRSKTRTALGLNKNRPNASVEESEHSLVDASLELFSPELSDLE